MGRPCDYTPKLALKICDAIADGKSLRAVCGEEGMPSRSTVFRWLKEKAEFRDQYARARQLQGDAAYDEILEVEEKLVDGQLEAQAARVLIQSKQWRAGKMRPKKYGDQARIDVNANVNHNLSDLSDDVINERIAELLHKAGLQPPDQDGEGGAVATD